MCPCLAKRATSRNSLVLESRCASALSHGLLSFSCSALLDRWAGGESGGTPGCWLEHALRFGRLLCPCLIFVPTRRLCVILASCDVSSWLIGLRKLLSSRATPCLVLECCGASACPRQLPSFLCSALLAGHLTAGLSWAATRHLDGFSRCRGTPTAFLLSPRFPAMLSSARSCRGNETYKQRAGENEICKQQEAWRQAPHKAEAGRLKIERRRRLASAA